MDLGARVPATVSVGLASRASQAGLIRRLRDRRTPRSVHRRSPGRAPVPSHRFELRFRYGPRWRVLNPDLSGSHSTYRSPIAQKSFRLSMILVSMATLPRLRFVWRIRVTIRVRDGYCVRATTLLDPCSIRRWASSRSASFRRGRLRLRFVVQGRALRQADSRCYALSSGRGGAFVPTVRLPW